MHERLLSAACRWKESELKDMHNVHCSLSISIVPTQTPSPAHSKLSYSRGKTAVRS